MRRVRRPTGDTVQAINPFLVLGIDEAASRDEIEAAYRQLVGQWHPDRYAARPAEEQAEAADRMAEITYAYELLTDPDEARTVVRPSAEKLSVHEAEKGKDFLDRFEGPTRAAVSRVVEAAQGLGMTTFYGTVGASLKIDVPGRDTPLSVAWLYPPGHNGIHGSRSFSVGYVTKAVDDLPAVRPRLEALVAKATTLSGAQPVPGAGLEGRMFEWDDVAEQLDAVLEMLEDVATGSTS